MLHVGTPSSAHKGRKLIWVIRLIPFAIPAGHSSRFGDEVAKNPGPFSREGDLGNHSGTRAMCGEKGVDEFRGNFRGSIGGICVMMMDG